MFLRILKTKNKGGLSYKFTVVKAIRTGLKVRQQVILHLGVFSEKNRHNPAKQEEFALKVQVRLRDFKGFQPSDRWKYKSRIYALFPQLEDADKRIAERRRLASLQRRR